MASKITNPATLRAIEPSEVTTYLEKHGWQRGDTWKNKAEIWSTADEELLFPLSKDVSDYAIRVSEVINTLAKLEGRSENAIYNALTAERGDVMRIRALHPDAEDGTIPLKDGLELIQGVYGMVLAAAAVTDEKRAFIPSRKAEYINEYMGQVRFGQTERGSFVVVVQSPTDTSVHDTQTENEIQEQPFGRRVITTLADALTSLSTEADKIQSDSPNDNDHYLNRVTQLVDQGVSVDLCDSILSLYHGSNEQMLEIGFSWSEQLPIEPPQVEKVYLNKTTVELSQRIGKTLKIRERQEEKKITGRVIRLLQGEDSNIANITIDAYIDGREKRIWIGLANEQDHDIAIRAYRQKARITCIGKLYQTRRRTYLRNYHDFKILE